MNTLVTGAAGFVGNATVERLQADGFDATELIGTHLAAGGETLRFADMPIWIRTRFLADRESERRHGSEAEDRVVEPSPDPPSARPMAQVLAEMP